MGHYRNFSFSPIIKCLIILLFPWQGIAQTSIAKEDIEITTQLTFIKVEEGDKAKFEADLSRLSSLAKEIDLSEDYDWLVYETDSEEYLFISFSSGLGDVLQLGDYHKAFDKLGKKTEFDSILNSLKNCRFKVTKNFLQEMLLPWSTVKEISTSKHPLTTMVEYKVYPNNMDAFDTRTRQLAKLLKETEYPYPLEGNRGALGAYGSFFHIWFYDLSMDQSIYDHIDEWMGEKGKKKEWQALSKRFEALSFSRKTYLLNYRPEMSY